MDDTLPYIHRLIGVTTLFQITACYNAGHIYLNCAMHFMSERENTLKN